MALINCLGSYKVLRNDHLSRWCIGKSNIIREIDFSDYDYDFFSPAVNKESGIMRNIWFQRSLRDRVSLVEVRHILLFKPSWSSNFDRNVKLLGKPSQIIEFSVLRINRPYLLNHTSTYYVSFLRPQKHAIIGGFSVHKDHICVFVTARDSCKQTREY